MKKILAFSGSNSPDSINEKLIHSVIERYSDYDIRFIDLKNFDGRDDRFRERYFKQFVELVGQRAKSIEESHKAEDREALWKAMHGARPQLVFFGVPLVQAEMEKVEINIKTLTDEELNGSVEMILAQMNGALEEIRSLLSTIN